MERDDRDAETETSRGTRGLVSVGLHSWTVQGDKRGCWAMKGQRQTERTTHRAGKNENLQSVKLQIALFRALDVVFASVRETGKRMEAGVASK